MHGVLMRRTILIFDTSPRISPLLGAYAAKRGMFVRIRMRNLRALPPECRRALSDFSYFRRTP
jgi:hypothetical protein